MSHLIGMPDRDLHWNDGTHRSTPASTNGHFLDLYHRRLTKHLERHDAELQLAVDIITDDEDYDDEG